MSPEPVLDLQRPEPGGDALMHALPAAPAPPPRRQVLVGTALAGVATVMLIGGMLAVWILQRERAIDAEGTWVPEGVTIPEVPANVMLIGVWALCVFAQWAVYAGPPRRQGRTPRWPSASSA